MGLDELLRLAQSGARGFTTGLLGAPVDIANMALGNVGGDKPVMGSEWIGDKLQGAGLLAPSSNKAAEFVGGLLGPGDIAAAAKGLLGGAKMAQIVFHGSPHTFDKFDMSKIGTGEGAQAYGHGLYFAENKNVATQYAGMGSGHLPKPSDSAHVAAAQDFLQNGMDPHVGLKSAYPGIKPTEIEAAVAEAKGGYKPNLYKVDIPDEAIGKMLDWDKPLSEQPKAVREALGDLQSGQFKMGPGGSLNLAGGGTLRTYGTEDGGLNYVLDMGGKQFRLSPSDVQNLIGTGVEGKSLYQVASSRMGGDVAASNYMKSLGIPGIKYADQGSRDWRILTPAESTSGKYVVGKWPGGGKEQRYFDNAADAQAYFNANNTHNYVLFDDSLAKIVGRE